MVGAVEIFEVGPRDGLQNEARLIPTSDKIALIDLLSQAGFRRIEVASFVPAKWVPQMADNADVLAGIRRAPGVSYAALTPNLKGYEGARAAKVDASIEESLARFKHVAEAAQQDGTAMRGYISCVTDCPFDGPAIRSGAGCLKRLMRCWARCWTRCQRPCWRGIFMTQEGWPWTTSTSQSRAGCGYLTPRLAVWAGAPMRTRKALPRGWMKTWLGKRRKWLRRCGMYNSLTLEVDARGVAVLTLNRPEKRNAMSGEMIAELHADRSP